MIEPLLPVAAPPRPLVEDGPGRVDPLEDLARVRHRRHPVLLFSGLPGHAASRFSVLSWDPQVTVSIRADGARVVRQSAGRATVETRGARDPFPPPPPLAPAGAVQRVAPGLPFAGGAIGYLGYGLS